MNLGASMTGGKEALANGQNAY
ncbi:rCG25606, partial [Rattus norvegicus]